MKVPIPTPIRQLGILFGDAITLRQLVFNRFTIVLAALLLLSVGVHAHVSANNDGRISGVVVGPDGEPVADANVTMRKISAESVESEKSTLTDENGRFVFQNQTSVLEFDIYAQKGGVGQSRVQRIHLYFRGENTEVELRLQETQTNDA